MTTITIERALLEQAIEKLLEYWPKSDPCINDLRAALWEPATAPEPVAWMWQHDETGRTGFIEAYLAKDWVKLNPRQPLVHPVYLHPPKPDQPAWHDAPTAPGVWFCDECDICYTWTAHNIEILDQFDPGSGLRWYGPIPQEPAP